MRESLRHLFSRFGRGKTNVQRSLTETQRQLIAAGLELFAERGYDSATTRDIAQRAGVAEKTLFANFGSKKRLFAEVLYPVLLELLEPEHSAGFAAILQNPSADFHRTAKEFVKASARLGRERPTHAKFLAREVLLNKEFRSLFFDFSARRLWPGMKALIEHAQRANQLRDAPPEAILRLLLYVGVGYELTIAVLAPHKPWDDDQEVATMTDLLCDGLLASAPATRGSICPSCQREKTLAPQKGTTQKEAP